ncbi:hypothetical protein FQZ97_614120 [compost metagenome]
MRVFALLLVLACCAFVQAEDRDLDNDGRRDGGIAPPPGDLYAAAAGQLQPILAHRDLTQ